jgi:hypothetical protein
VLKDGDDVVKAAIPIAQSIVDGKRTSLAGSELQEVLAEQGYNDHPNILRGIIR